MLPGTPKSGAWSNASLASSKAAEAVFTFRQQRSPSPGARAAAARIAAFKAEVLIEPLIQRVIAGYMLLEPELMRLRRYTAILDARERTGALTRGGEPTTHLRDIERASRNTSPRRAQMAYPGAQAGVSPQPLDASPAAAPLPTNELVRKGRGRVSLLPDRATLSPRNAPASTRGIE